MCMEGIEQNPVVYELKAEMPFRAERTDLEIWVGEYVERRYGEAAVGAQEAWKLLYHTIYNCSDGIADNNKDVIVQFPNVNPSSANVFHGLIENLMTISEPGRRPFFLNQVAVPGHLWYPPDAATKALRSLLHSAYKFAEVPQYRYL
ncbi:hypothetical protein O6H91_02G055100 [Diphasiastrum complanatum]|uniref:Uncharacterized protein n=2 Tax=Diphasiastrum complanatum TaxID=34168 RepID=A0ACC2EFL6_DIPCM|nr:hypothetical protein O6H91_02G055100 [Diphasiastrum complanatum]KAJ7565287.1 hypothetical protein O6H91_02G055100 [Diphasiastrum complanatum]